MRKLNLINNIFSAIRGEFTPSQFSARLFMTRDDLYTPENYLTWFHERFHYLQSIFTPYGHLKWAAYRTVTSDILEAWLTLTNTFASKKIPIHAYLSDNTKGGFQIASTIWMQDISYQIYNTIERGITNDLFKYLSPQINVIHTCPKISILGKPHFFRGLDIIESFAKFEEAMLNELITGKSLGESINPNYLNKEYYSALYYFIEELGIERLIEFPIVCELSLATPHIPFPKTIDNFYDNAPNWRFVKIVDILKKFHDFPQIDFHDNSSFFEYSNAVLSFCGYESWDVIWNAAEEYAKSSKLTMSKNMIDAINYKKANPWMLSYPICNLDSFTSKKFNEFIPYFTITNDSIMYNIDKISSTELLFENHLQALSLQICGHISKYCINTDKLMCGYSYMGLKNCPHYISGECDGYIDRNSTLPVIILDEHKNIKSGCTFEMILNISGTSIRNINISRIQSISFEDIMKASKKYCTSNFNTPK